MFQDVECVKSIVELYITLTNRKMKLYDLVKEILIEEPFTRNSDKGLIWEVLNSKGLLVDGCLTWERFKRCPSFESITRARRKVQEIHPELQANEAVREVRRQKSMGNPIDIFKDL